nr:hypothetical protein [Desulfobulbaceae bacterium]
MDVELFLDFDEVTAENQQIALKKFNEWYADGAEVRHNKISFGTLTKLDNSNRFLIDFGYAEPIVAIRNLHARIRNHGVKVFVHFIY